MNRYGRHGPDAWKLWQKKYKQKQTPLVVNKPSISVIVINVPVPIQIGRTIIIVDSTIDKSAENQDQLDAPTTEQHKAINSSRISQELSLVEQAADEAGRSYFLDQTIEQEQFSFRPYQKEHLERRARKLAGEYIINNYANKRIHIDNRDDIVNPYITSFVSGYKNELEKSRLNGTIRSEYEQGIVDQAHQDKKFLEMKGWNT